ncbi:MAG: C10 family peptidase, partial [Bacteroidales bacterium]|nr:C10 family peptidase [Bacteroidales bacterium]
MRTAFIFTGLLLFCGLTTFAEQVDADRAKLVGLTFLSHNLKIQKGNTPLELDLVYASTSDNGQQKKLPTTFFYVYNAGTSGFVIVAGDDRVTPILGYSNEDSFDPDNLAPAARKWLDAYKMQIRTAIERNLSATGKIQQEWTYYSKGMLPPKHKDNLFVLPLVQTKWNQGIPYNALCPGGSYTGCIATAMAQVMKYWEHPTKGIGSRSYNHQKYGMLSANFGATTYLWDSMPNTGQVLSANNAVATLMYHCGVSVAMNYSTSASSAYTHATMTAFKTYFAYNDSARYILRSSYTDSMWIDVLKTELDASRPILYSGFTQSSGHAFVCDGYDANGKFHFNWGWGGSSDGYFIINALVSGYNLNHEAVIGISPKPAATQTNDICLFDNLLCNSVTQTVTVPYQQAFTVTASIQNRDTANNFTGDFSAFILDDQYNVVASMDSITASLSPLGGGDDTVALSFTMNGLPSMFAGTYYIMLYCKPANGTWTPVSDYLYFINKRQLNIGYTSPVTLDTMGRSSEFLIQGQPVSVDVNLSLSLSPSIEGVPFSGSCEIGLLHLDGSQAQAIGAPQGNITISKGSSSGIMTFSDTVTLAPGTYYLAVFHTNDGDTIRTLTGSSRYYPNPVKVIVQAPPLYPDKYEVNDTLYQAYELPLVFLDDTALVTTMGSNMHIETDVDHYKIELSSAYEYTVSARVHDAENSGDGNTYSVDVSFSYS